MPDDESLIVVDIGNSRTRFARLEWHGAVLPTCIQKIHVATANLDNARMDQAAEALQEHNASWIAGSVHQAARDQLAAWHQERFSSVGLRFLTRLDFPIDLRVQQPDRLGIDRLSAVFAAGRLKSPGSAAVVVDAGTAITVDAVAADGAFLGGVILPGMELALRALATQTSQLPRLAVPSSPPTDPLIGTNTEQAITSGVYWGSVGAISMIVELVRDELASESVVFLTGGAGRVLQPHLRLSAQLQPDLVLQGLALAAIGQ